MKKTKKEIFAYIICALCVIVIGLSIFRPTGHTWIRQTLINVPKFSTKYTVEEHLQRLNEIANEKYIGKEYLGDKFYDLDIYILYSYAGDPEYFLMEFTYSYTISKEGEERLGFVYWYSHGFIMNDEYYAIFRQQGQSGFRKDSLLDYKKYYDGREIGYEKDGVVYRGGDIDGGLSTVHVVNYPTLQYCERQRNLMFYSKLELG